MLTLAAAGRLLAAATSLESLAPVARALGFTGAPLPLAGHQDLHPGAHADGARLAVAAGPGLLRALLVESTGAAPLREVVQRLAGRLARAAPHPLWCVLAVDSRRGQLAVAAWSGDRTPPRIAALVADRAHLVDSDAETLRALAAAAGGDDVLVHAAWLDVLGRDALTRRFYRELEAVVGAMAAAYRPGRARLGAAERQELALLQLSRLLFLSFVEARGWLDGDHAFLARGVARWGDGGTGAHRRLLRPLFFGTLNTPPARRAAAARAFGRVPFLNGGLFTPTALERRAADALLPDDALSLAFDRLLLRYRFTAREDQVTWSEAAVDPEMLGRAFESLMHGGTRRASGAYYTPQALVAHLTRLSLARALAAPAADATPEQVGAVLDGADPGELAPALRARLHALRVLDPACGSGAFLVHVLETLADLALRCGDARPIAAVRRQLLASSIFGVDVNPMAVWLCELRLWLSAVIDCAESDPLRLAPLPNLDHHIRVGDTLAGGAFDGAPDGGGEATRAPRLAALRTRYARATGPRKRALGRALDQQERAAADGALEARLAVLVARRRDLVAALRTRDLFGERAGDAAGQRATLAELRDEVRQLRLRRRQLRDGTGLPFAFASHFPDAAARGGFDLVVGNPPWVRVHHIPAAQREQLRRAFASYRDAAWRAGAAAAGAARGFAGQVDAAALFTERGVQLLAPSGTLGFLLPAKLWRSLAGGGLRRLLAERARLVALEDWSEARHRFDAAVYPSVLVATRADGRAVTSGAPAPPVAFADVRDDQPRRWCAPAASLPLREQPDSPWLLVPPDVRRAFDALAAAGTPLAGGRFGRPLLGVKCGCNHAFLLRHPDRGAVTPWSAELRADRALRALAADVEPELLRPGVRGETLRAWRARAGVARILWTHDPLGAPRAQLPPGARRWLERWRAELERRSDARQGGRWWSLFRTEAAGSDRPRVVWSDFGRAPRAAVLAAGDPTVPLNTCYALRCADERDALALAALLGSPLVAAWLSLVAEPARGGWRRYLAWTMALLPLPADWTRARDALAPIGARGWCGDSVADEELGEAARDAYGVPASVVAPLLAWSTADHPAPHLARSGR